MDEYAPSPRLLIIALLPDVHEEGLKRALYVLLVGA
jgi:hypothetical protein